MINDSKYYINENYISNEFIFDSNIKSGEIELLSYSKNKDKNLILPFAREIDANGMLTNNILEHTLELDLNVWKPTSMDDETFLKEMTYDVNLKIIDNVNSKGASNIANNISSYNINDDNVSKLYSKNWNNLFVDKISIIENKVNYIDKKLVYNFTFSRSKHLGDIGYCFLGFDVVHQQSHNLNKPNAINRLLITPKIYYDQIGKGSIANYNFTIPSQEIKLFFYNNFFNFDNQNNISVDSYISDKQSFNLYENDIDSGNNSVPSRRLLLDTSKGLSNIVSIL